MMFRRSILFWSLIIILGFANQIFAQGFIKYYTPTGPTRIDNSLPLGNGDVLLLANMSYNGVFQPALLFIDGEGTVEWFSSGYFDQTTSADYIEPTNDGGFIFAAISATGNAINDIAITKVDATGILEWQYTLPDYGPQEYYEAFFLDEQEHIYVYSRTGNFISDDVRLTKLDMQGQVLYDLIYPVTTPDFRPEHMMLASDGFLYGIGFRYDGNNNSINGNVIVQYDPFTGAMTNFEELNQPSDGSQLFFNIVETPDNHMLTFGSRSFFSGGNGFSEVRKATFSGDEVWSVFVGSSVQQYSDEVFFDNGDLVLGYQKNSAPYLLKLSADGSQTIWQRNYPDIGPATTQVYSFGPDGVGGYVITGVNTGNGMPFVGWAVRTDSLGYWTTNDLSGKVFDDFNLDCLHQNGETKLPNWLIAFEKDFPVYRQADENGEYDITLDTGTYSMDLISPGLYWETCEVPDLTLVDFFQENTQDFGAFPIVDCSQMQVSIGTDRLRRCDNNN
ncbi:MAG: hypothetical protein AAFV80_22510 [Bacteroidota bacterium]